jgi:DNA-binding NtrC family response regulator
LTEFGYNVLTAHSPEEALALAENEDRKIHLLLTDVVMPGMNGKTLEKKIKKLKPDIKILFMSGYTNSIIAERGVLEDDLGFIQKPFSFTTLARKVRRSLDEGEIPALMQ